MGGEVGEGVGGEGLAAVPDEAVHGGVRGAVVVEKGAGEGGRGGGGGGGGGGGWWGLGEMGATLLATFSFVGHGVGGIGRRMGKGRWRERGRLG